MAINQVDPGPVKGRVRRPIKMLHRAFKCLSNLRVKQTRATAQAIGGLLQASKLSLTS